MIYLMRHGQSVVNIEHRLTCRHYAGDLTDLGRAQAEKAGHWLIGKGIAQIHYSPFHRAEQTAQIIGKAVGVVATADEALCEMNCGSLEGHTDEAAWAIWTQVYERWCLFEADARFPDGEAYGEAVERFKRALDGLAPDEPTLLVTHGGITRTVIPPLCVNAAALQRVDHLDNTGMIVLEHYDPERYYCSAWNLTEHLRD